MTSQIERIKAAIHRLDYYGAPPDDSAVYVSRSGGSFYELLDGIEGVPITLGDLRLLVATLPKED